MQLEPCPFCGETEHLQTAADDHKVVCFVCGAKGPWAEARDQAIANWNRRPTSTLIHFADGSPVIAGKIAPHLTVPIEMTGIAHVLDTSKFTGVSAGVGQPDDLTAARERRELAGLPSMSTEVSDGGLSMDFDLGGPGKGKR